MTSMTQVADTSNQFRSDESFKDVAPVCESIESKSNKGSEDVLADRIISIRAGAADQLQMPYNVERERARIMNRLYNLGVPESKTSTDF